MKNVYLVDSKNQKLLDKNEEVISDVFLQWNIEVLDKALLFF